MSDKVTGEETADFLEENAVKILIIVLSKTTNGFIKITESDIANLVNEKKNIVCQSQPRGFNLFLAEESELETILKDPESHYRESK